jgi:anaerobic selenocysteine-containing dehydrogenase
VARDGAIGYVEGDRIVKLEGNPKLPRTNGKLCAKGQAGINQVYDPDRVLYPLKRVGKRGEGKWKRISWDEALDLLVNGGRIAGRKVKGLKTLRDEGHPEKFMFHYGRMKASSSKIIKTYFLGAYGTGTVGNHTSICESAKWTAQELTWGGHYDNNDFAHTNMIINFGCNLYETHTNHLPLVQKLIEGRVKRGAKLVTFDVRLSNTAGRSDEWIPIKPGTDLAVVLAMSNVIMQENLYDQEFIEKWTNVTPDQLKSHLRQYTPEWAEGISGVPAKKIRSLAIEYANAKPGCLFGYRGACMHYNGVQTERAMLMIDAICGYIDVKGGKCRAVGAGWKNSFPKPKTKKKKLKIVDGFPGDYAYPTHHASHQVLKMIKDGRWGRPEIYMVYCYTPVYANGEMQENIDILKDESLIPFYVNVNTSYDESAALADLILPDATYLERWDWEDMVCPSQIPEYYIRQPLAKPLGEARDFKDVCCELAKRLGLSLGFSSAEEFVRDACEHTPGVKEAGGFEYMKRHGAWYDKTAKPKYLAHTQEIPAEDLKGTIVDEKTGVVWKGKPGQDYTTTKKAYKKYVGQKIGDKVYRGFPPDKVNKSGLFEIYSELLKKKGFDPMPSWMPIPEHQRMKKDELILTTYKVNVQTHSRSQNCKWLTEIYHDNPAWINPKTAAARGIKDGDMIKVKSKVGEIKIKAHVTEGIHPDVIAIAHHVGHWEYGRYASGKKAPFGRDDDPDLKLIWWKEHGVRPNWIIPNAGDPISGTMRWMDTVVSVTKA